MRRPPDILGIDRDANLVVIELKRTEDGGHMDLQAIRYAAMVSTMTFDKALVTYAEYLANINGNLDPRSALLEFLDWEEPDEDSFAQDVRIVLVAADFSKELTTAVMWLNKRQLDIRRIRLKPYQLGEQILIDAQQLVPIPEAIDYQIQIAEKEQKERSGRKRKWNKTTFMQELLSRKGETAQVNAKEILDWITPRVTRVWWGEGQKHGGFVPVLAKDEVDFQLFKVGTGGKVVIWIDHLRKTPPFHDPSKCE